MRPDQFKKHRQAPRVDDRARRQIAIEAARRMLGTIGPESGDPSGRLRDASEAEYYAAKRKAAAVLGRPVRPGDLPSDSEIREQALILIRDAAPVVVPNDSPEPEPGEELARMADHVDRFAIYKLRLMPLESVKQPVKPHPEGDALYHSLQVFDLARDARPYDEEFLLAALLHDVGKAIDPHNHVKAALEALRGAVPPRTLALIEHHAAFLAAREKPGAHPPVDDPDLLEDLKLLRELDNAGRVPGASVGTVDEALDYLRGLEHEEYLEG
ncbi:HD domain-containing protein [Tundrisphaera lichenicola]|uniref:HD domain-containing protein n=1 Tax=Tundrisphaera lichenicola TaxID=2029860 RepID=UPI003EBB4E15